MFGRIGTLVHPVLHPRDEPALVDLSAAAPRVVVPLTGEGLDQPGGLGAQDVEQVLVGQRQGFAGDVKSSTKRFRCKSNLCFSHRKRTVSVNPPPHISLNLKRNIFNRNQQEQEKS